ncbi:MAG TPA: PIN domain-containing protein [Candidatus Binatia bacterium]|nr:PIN domain-containing protein [Candidatus Binatia bacterium]
MSGRYFLDTNIFAYAAHPAPSSKTRVAVKLIEDGLDTGNGIVSYQVVQEFFSLAFRKFAKPMSAFEAEEYLNTVFRPLLAVHSSPALYVSALQVYGRYHFSWYDSLIVAAAQQAGCAILYTEDLQHDFTVDGMRIRDPFR